MNFRKANGRSRALLAIDITSLVDVVFLLLIFLLVTTTFKKPEHAFVLELPTSSTEQVVIAADRTTVYVDQRGSLHLLVVPRDATPTPEELKKAEKVSTATLRKRLKALFDKDPEATIEIKGARSTSYESIAKVIGYIKDAGFSTVHFPYEFTGKGGDGQE